MGRKDFLNLVHDIAKCNLWDVKVSNSDWLIEISEPQRLKSEKSLKSPELDLFRANAPETTRIVGYTFDVNSSVSAELCNDKSLTCHILRGVSIPCVEHVPFLSSVNPLTRSLAPKTGLNQAVLDLMTARKWNSVVIKPARGTGGHLVFYCSTSLEIECAINAIQSAMSCHFPTSTICVCPQESYDDEVRMLVFRKSVYLAYSKKKIKITGDGKSCVAALLRSAISKIPDKKFRDSMLSKLGHSLPGTVLMSVPSEGEDYKISKLNNLGLGSYPDFFEPEPKLAQLALDACEALGVRMASVDVFRSQGSYKILEVNAGVMVDNLLEMSLTDKAFNGVKFLVEDALRAGLGWKMPDNR